MSRAADDCAAPTGPAASTAIALVGAGTAFRPAKDEPQMLGSIGPTRWLASARACEGSGAPGIAEGELATRVVTSGAALTVAGERGDGFGTKSESDEFDELLAGTPTGGGTA
jgi:hypothetical protein